MANSKTTKAALPKAESIPIRMPLPVESLVLLMLITMLVPSCGCSRHGGSGCKDVGELRKYDVERVPEVVEARAAIF